jgi:DNA repair protein RadC
MHKTDTSRKAYQILKKCISTEVEEVWILALNSELRLIEKTMLFRGTVNYCFFHPRDVFKFLYTQNAVSFILAHSHPSGNHLPSRLDQIVTARIVSIGQMMEVPVVDHLIISQENYFSFADSGLISKYKQKKTVRLT